MRKIQKDYPSIQYLAYADDMILYSDNDEEFEKFLTALSLRIGSNHQSLVDYSAAQITNKDLGFSGARTCNLEEIPRAGSLPPLTPFEEFGLVISVKKSQVSRQRNQWKMSFLKFLGITYTPGTNEIASSTRKGKHLVWTFHNLTNYIERTPYMSRPTLMQYFLKNEVKQNLGKVIYLYLILKTNEQLKITKKLIQRYLQMTKPTLTKIYNKIGWLKQYKELLTKSDPKESNQANQSHTKEFAHVYSGILQSRLYLGTKTIKHFDTPSGAQNFKLTMKPGSLSHILKSKNSGINIHNGSSYITNYLLNVDFANPKLLK